MKHKRLASDIVEALGGVKNIKSVINCMTRVRVDVSQKIDKDKIKSIDGVMGVVEQGNNYQVIVGPGTAQKVADTMVENYKLNKGVFVGDWEENKADLKSMQKQTPLKRFLKTIANIFIPLIPAIIAAGLFNGFGSLIGQLTSDSVLSGDTWKMIELMFKLIGGAFYAYFAVFTGVNAAKVFGATEALGGIIGGITIGANIVSISKMMNLFNEEIPLESILTTGKGGIIGVIFGVWILAVVEKRLRKIVPDVLDLIVTPFASLLTVAIALVFVIMPLAGYLSDGLVYVLSLLVYSDNAIVSVISGYVLSALFLPMVLLGLHHGLIPIYTIQLQQFGAVSLFPVLAMAGAGQVGAAISIYLKAKRLGNSRLKKVIVGALPAGFLGVGEPLIYGVTLPMFKPFITAGLGAGFGGAWVMLSQVTSVAWGPSGLVAIPLMSKPTMMLNYFIGLVISYFFGFVITNIFIKDEEVLNV